MDRGDDPNNKIIMIEDRSVKSIPLELETTFQVEPSCAACNKTTENHPLRTCSSCKLVSYCSRECQASDWARHKKEDHCSAVKKARSKVEEAEVAIRCNCKFLVSAAIDAFGEEAFLWKDVQDVNQIGQDEIFDLLAGRFLDLPWTREYMEQFISLHALTLHVAAHYNNRMVWERVLELTTEIKRLVHLSAPDFDQDLPLALLRLYRTDDANGYLFQWLWWQQSNSGSIRPNPQVVPSIKGQWPYLCADGGRWGDLSDEIRSYNANGKKCPIQVVMISLAVKLRYVCIYRKLEACADAFRSSTAGQALPPDVCKNIASFVNGDKNRARCFGYQWDHVNKLLNYIDEEYPCILPAVLEEDLLPPAAGIDVNLFNNQDFDETDLFEQDGQSFNVKRFFETWEGSPPVLALLTDVLKLRYGYSERGVSIEGEDEWTYSWDTVLRDLAKKQGIVWI